MKILSNLNLKTRNVLKIVGLVLVVIIFLTLVSGLIKSSIGSFSSQSFDTVTSSSGIAKMNYTETDESYSLSARNVASSMPQVIDEVVMGDDAEEFEVTEYNANIETRHLVDVCGEIAGLKSREDVIFENASEYEKSCNYSFKVKRDSVEDVLSIIEALDPKELNENTFTIKRLIDDYTSEVEILEKKMASIEDTLNNAVIAYDDITRVATRAQDAESLAKIIDSKIRIIERLTQEKINIIAQLDRLGRSRAEQLDRLEYTYFNIYVLENKFVDGQVLKDSWRRAVKSFVLDLNDIIQSISINLVLVLFIILQFSIYAFIVLIVAKYGWKLVKNIWNK